MCEQVAELLPPVFADDLALLDFVDAPELLVAFFAEEDCLEDVVLERGRFRGIGTGSACSRNTFLALVCLMDTF